MPKGRLCFHYRTRCCRPTVRPAPPPSEGRSTSRSPVSYTHLPDGARAVGCRRHRPRRGHRAGSQGGPKGRRAAKDEAVAASEAAARAASAGAGTRDVYKRQARSITRQQRCYDPRRGATPTKRVSQRSEDCPSDWALPRAAHVRVSIGSSSSQHILTSRRAPQHHLEVAVQAPHLVDHALFDAGRLHPCLLYTSRCV